MIRPVSKARQEDWKKYLAVKKQWRKDPKNLVCCVLGCTRPSEPHPHHSVGRIGRLLYDPRWFKPVCWTHHAKVKEDPIWARANGLLPAHGQYNSVPKQ